MTVTARAIKVGNLTAAATSAAATDAGGSSATLFLAQGSQGALAVISGTWTATLQFEGRAAGGTWFAVPAVAIATTGGALASSTTANGNFLIAAVGVIELRVRCSAYTSGTAVVELSNAVVGGFSLPVTGTASGANANQVQGNVAVGAAVSGGNPFGMGASDGTNLAYLLTETATRLNLRACLFGAGNGPVVVVSPSDGLAVQLGLAVLAQQVAWNGASQDRVRTAAVFTPVALGAGTTETTIWTPTTGKKFRLIGFALTVGAASTLTFKDNTGGTTIYAARGTTDTPIVVTQMGNGKLSAAANNVLTVTRGTSATLDGTLWGTEE